jgi:hypothetical protein
LMNLYYGLKISKRLLSPHLLVAVVLLRTSNNNNILN